jgi:lipoprotein-anchoring transpeptidase ErfK/SrfK
MKRAFLFLLLITGMVFAVQAKQQPKAPAAEQPPKSSATKLKPKLEVQIWLDRKGYSPGEIDGTAGKNTEKALAVFQLDNKLPTTPVTDPKTLDTLREQSVEPIIKYQVTEQDVKGPFIEMIPKSYMEQAKLPSLGYTSATEALSEKFHVSQEIFKRLNPSVNLAAGVEIQVPNIFVDEKADNSQKVQPVGGKKSSGAPDVSIVVSKDKQQLEAKDGDGKTILFAPITAGSEEYPYPMGSWKVVGVSRNPHFDYNPALFKDAPPTDRKAKLPPGPNSPVGTVWIDISAEHYGIHGTPEPGRIGYSESHGCIRLTNWDVEKLAALVRPGTPVIFE